MDQSTVNGIRAILTGGSVIGLIISVFLLILGLMALFMPFAVWRIRRENIEMHQLIMQMEQAVADMRQRLADVSLNVAENARCEREANERVHMAEADAPFRRPKQ